MPKLHKPAFLKKKKTDGDAAPDAEGDTPAEGMYTIFQKKKTFFSASKRKNSNSNWKKS